ncbi:MAG TPA: hypothetical protein VFA12_10840 [Stellaceae bacterium]|nr:hypothetical protein [Stellaceae bacterium]
MKRRGYRHVRAIVLGVLICFSAAASAQAPPGVARVWFLRSVEAQSKTATGAAPTIYANGAPIGRIPVGTDFYRDLPPGTYRFTVEPYGLPTPQASTLQLTSGSQAYLQVQWEASWQFGYPEAGWSFAPNTFVITPMAPRLAQAYLPTLRFIGGG